MARKQTFSAQSIIKIAIFGVLIGAIVWSVFGRKEAGDVDPNYGTGLSPSTSVLQQQVIDTLNQKINSEAQINKNNLEVSGNQASMEIKLSALIRASTADIDPTDNQLVQFYYNHSSDYTSDARIEFLYRLFKTADHGGNAANIASKSLESMISPDTTLSGTKKVREEGYNFDFQTQIDNTFGFGFAGKLITLINQKTASLPCWDGPISGHNGVYLICVKSYQPGVLPDLVSIKERVINDWRLSLSNES
jgi:hypothetical protein